MLPSYFDHIFVHLRQKACLRPELSPKFLSSLDPNPTRKARPDLQLCVQTQLREDGFCQLLTSLIRSATSTLVLMEALIRL